MNADEVRLIFKPFKDALSTSDVLSLNAVR
jgi:hypothetical protein